MESLPSVSCACFLPTHEGWFKFKSRSGNVNSPHSRPNLPLHSKTGFILGVRSGGSESTTLGVATKVRAKTPCRSSSSSSSTASSQLAGGNELDLPRDSGSGTSDRPRKVVSVPGLPHDATPVVSCFWEWKSKFSVHYEKSGVDNIGAPALLLLPGFGVGTFHYEKQLHDLGRDHRVYALDFLGQGKSLPSEDPTRLAIGSSEKSGKRNDDDDDDDDDVWGFGEETEPWADDLVYSMDLWRDQVRSFINQVTAGKRLMREAPLLVMRDLADGELDTDADEDLADICFGRCGCGLGGYLLWRTRTWRTLGWRTWTWRTLGWRTQTRVADISS